MPALPQFGNIMRHIRQIEVARQIEAQYFGNADRHIGISRKIEINLEGIGDHRQQDCKAAERFWRGVNLIDKNRQPVGQHDLFKQTKDKYLYACLEALRTDSSIAMCLNKKVTAALDRSGRQLREKRKVKRYIKQILCFHFSALDIRHIADGAKCVKRYAKRHDQIQCRKVIAKQLCKRFDEKVGIFEESQ